jgi:hypothetical protein
MIEADGNMNDRLQEQTARSTLVRPRFFEHFVTREELACVEE